MIETKQDIEVLEASLISKIKDYEKSFSEIENVLLKKPDEWGRHQGEVNRQVDNIFCDISNFERITIANEQKDRLDKFRDYFVKNIRKSFLKGHYIEWSLHKPHGYAGDFEIMDEINVNNPTSIGVKRLYDNYYQRLAICSAVRNRKEDFKRHMVDFASMRQGKQLRIMSLSSGPSREIQELLLSNESIRENVFFDCYDHDENALKYAKDVLMNFSKVDFIQENALKMSLAKDINSRIDRKYDLIYATGLFDYLNYKISVKLIANLKKLLNANGALLISDARDRYSNPSAHFMEWIAEWHLIYRSDEEFKQIFIEAGFKEKELKVYYEQQGIFQYILAYNA